MAPVQGKRPNATTAIAPATAQIASGHRNGRVMTPAVAKAAIPHVASVLSVRTINLRSYSPVRSVQVTTAFRIFQEKVVRVEHEARSRQCAFSIDVCPPNWDLPRTLSVLCPKRSGWAKVPRGGTYGVALSGRDQRKSVGLRVRDVRLFPGRYSDWIGIRRGRLVEFVRQNRQRMKGDAFVVQFLGLFRGSFAIDRAVLGLAIMNLARLFGKALADIIGVLDDVFAQFFELLAQLAFLRRHDGDVSFSRRRKRHRHGKRSGGRRRSISSR